MYTYFLSDYISAMSSVDIRKLKKITKAEFIQLISLLISMFLVIVTMILYQLKRTQYYLIINILFVLILYLIEAFIYILNNKRWNENNKDNKQKQINDYIERLKSLQMYSEKDILWLIEQSKKYYQEESHRFSVGNIISLSYYSNNYELYIFNYAKNKFYYSYIYNVIINSCYFGFFRLILVYLS